MSILSSLLSFSCLNQSSRSPRSTSVGARFLFQQITPKNKNNQQIKNSSKSLTKLDLFSTNLPKIDPRSRCLHRLVHRLNMKTRKHYYQLFVILEAMRKNNVKIRNENGELNENRETGIKKMTEIINLAVTKNYERVQKQYIFNMVKQIGKWRIPLRKLIKLLDKNRLKRSFVRMKENYEQLQKQRLKIEIFQQVCETFLKNNQRKAGKIIGFENIKIYSQAKTIQIQKPNQFDQIFLTPKNKNTPHLQIQTQQTYFSPQNHIPALQISPAFPINRLNEMLHVQAIDSYQTITQSYYCSTRLNQLPLSFEQKQEHFPQVTKKILPQDLGLQEVGDLQDISSLFRNFSKSSSFKTISGIQQASLSEIGAQSLWNYSNMVNEFQGMQYSQRNCKRVNERNERQKKPRINTIKTSDSLFGVDAVSFKNCLVMERQSLTNQKISFPKNSSQRIKNSEEKLFRKKLSNQVGGIKERNIAIREEQVINKRLQFPEQKQITIKSGTIETCPIKPKSYSFNCRKNPADLSLQIKIEEKFKQIQQQQMKLPLTSRKKPVFHDPITHHSNIVYERRQNMMEDILPVRDTPPLEQTRERRVSYPTNKFIKASNKKFLEIVQK